MLFLGRAGSMQVSASFAAPNFAPLDDVHEGLAKLVSLSEASEMDLNDPRLNKDFKPKLLSSRAGAVSEAPKVEAPAPAQEAAPVEEASPAPTEGEGDGENAEASEPQEGETEGEAPPEGEEGSEG